MVKRSGMYSSNKRKKELQRQKKQEEKKKKKLKGTLQVSDETETAETGSADPEQEPSEKTDQGTD